MPDRLTHPADLLDRYSAALRNDRRTPAPEDLDAGVTDIARAVEQAGHEVDPDSGAIERVWQAIDAADKRPDWQRAWATPPHAVTPNGHVRRIDEPDTAPLIPTPIRESAAPTFARPRNRSRDILQLVAELLLLIVGAGLLVLLFRGSGDQAGNTGTAPATATPDARFNQRAVADWQINGSTLDGSVLAGLGIAPDGTLYVADFANSRILHLRADGSLITTFGRAGSGAGELLLDQGSIVPSLGIDSAGNVYVPDYGNSRVQIFAPGGSYLTTWDASNSPIELPTAVAVDLDDNVFIVDYSMSENRLRILKLDRDGNHLLSIEPDENGEGRFEHLAGIAVDSDGNLYVCDVGTNRILKFDYLGRFLLAWGGSGSEPGLFNEPSSIAVDQRGTVFVTDEFNFRVQRFDTTGQYFGEWGNTAGASTTFDRPVSVAAGTDGAIYIVDRGNTLHRFRLEFP